MSVLGSQTKIVCFIKALELGKALVNPSINLEQLWISTLVAIYGGMLCIGSRTARHIPPCTGLR